MKKLCPFEVGDRKPKLKLILEVEEFQLLKFLVQFLFISWKTWRGIEKVIFGYYKKPSPRVMKRGRERVPFGI